MEIVVAVLALVGIVSAVNLTLIVVMLRRWREIETASAPHSHQMLPQELGVHVGDGIPRFSATAVDGNAVSDTDFTGRETLVGFLSLDCRACTDSVPYFTDAARELHAAGGRVLAVVVGEDAADSDLTASMSAVADVVVAEALDSPLSNRFQVAAYPSFVRYDSDGVATLAGTGISTLQRGPVPA